MLVLLRGGLKNSLTAANLRQDLVQLGVQAASAEAFSERWRARYIDLSRSLIGHTLTVNKLLDIEWKFGVTASTDDVQEIGATFLQLRLVVDRGQSVAMELTLPQFYAFLAEMEKAKSSLDYLS